MSAATEQAAPAPPVAYDLAAEYGIPVFPCRSQTEIRDGREWKAKAPLTPRGFADATTDLDTIDSWWRRWPDALVGVPTGNASGLLVVDVDPDGTDWHTENADRLACGRVHRTRRGHHLVYAMPATDIRCSTSNVAEGIDVRGNGGYVIWWPAHGHEAVGDFEDITAPPAWLVDALTQPERAREPRNDTPPTIPAREWPRVLDALKSIPADDYDEWLRVGHGLHATGHPQAFDTWDQWSQTSSKYAGRDDLARRWAGFSTDRPRKVTWRSILAMAKDDGETWPEPLDLAELLKYEPQRPSMIIDDWLPAGYATLLAGHGGAGKSSIALNLAVCLATGRHFFGLEVEQRRVLYLSCEDRADVLHWRLARILDYLGLSTAEVTEGLAVLDLVGHDALLWRREQGFTTTASYSALRDLIRAMDSQVIIVDGVADVYGGTENDRAEVKQFLNAMIALAPTDGAVLLLHHVNRATASGGGTTEGYSGSTGWHNAVRARWYLHPETERTDEGAQATGDLVLDLQKSNLGRTDQSMRFRWDDQAHLFVGEVERSTTGERKQRDDQEQRGIVEAIREIESQGDYIPAAAQGPRTALHVLSAAKSFPDGLQSRSARRRFWRHVEVLRRIGTVVESSIRRANGHRTATLTLKAAQDKGCAGLSHSPESNTTPCGNGDPIAELPHSAGGTRGCAREVEGTRKPTGTPSPR